MKNAATVVGGVLVLAGIAGILALRDRGADSGPETPAPSPEPLAETPAPAGSPFEILCRRSRDEILVFARRREFGRPAVGLEVRLLDAAGTALRIGRTDEFGVLRAAVPEGAVSIACGMGESFVASDLPPPPPPAAAPPLPILADRTVVRPGDTVRFCVWDYGAPEGVLSFEPADPAVEPVTFSRLEELQPGFPGPRKHWVRLEARIPDDVRPGRAVAIVGESRLEFPILPRFGPASDGAPKAEGGLLALRPPASTELKVELVDESWRVECREEFSVALLYATSGDRFLTHGAVPGEGKEALAALFLEDEKPAAERVHAVVSTARGFLEASVAVPESPGGDRRLRVDPETHAGAAVAEEQIRAFVEADGRTVPAALAVAVEDPSGALPETILVTAESHEFVLAPLSLGSGGDRHVRVLALPRDGGPPLRGETTVLGAEPARIVEGPAWVYEGDSVGGAEKQPPTRPATMDIIHFAPLGESPPFAEEGVALPPGALFTWSIRPTESAAAIRMRAGDAIVLETLVGAEKKDGFLRAGLLAGGLIRVESSVSLSDRFGVFLMCCDVPVRFADVPPRPHGPGPALAIERDLPVRVAAGSVVEAKLRVSALPGPSVEGPLHVRFRLPAGAVPAEDAWSVRERSPAGTRVEFRDGEVLWILSGLEAPATFTVRLRFPWKGRFGVPPAMAVATESVIRHGRTGGAVVVVE